MAGMLISSTSRLIRQTVAGVLLIASVTGCSTSKFAAVAMVPVLDNARDVAMASNDVRTFRDAAPANLFLIEGLIATAPDDRGLRLNAAMLYFSYAFAFIEDNDRNYASLLYRKGFKHGQAAVTMNRRFIQDWDVRHDEFVKSLEKLKKDDVPSAVWAAINWVQFISLHLDSTAVLADISKVASLLERIAEIDGDYFEGITYAMIGSLHSFRPPMMGGSPQKSLENFEKAFAVNDTFMLSKYLFARFYLYRIQDAESFEETLTELIEGRVPTDNPYQLLNLIARQKSTLLLGEIDELF